MVFAIAKRQGKTRTACLLHAHNRKANWRKEPQSDHEQDDRGYQTEQVPLDSPRRRGGSARRNQ